MAIFKIGYRVKLIGRNEGTFYPPLGTIGEITQTLPDIGDFVGVIWANKNEPDAVPISFLEIVDDNPIFQEGDVVIAFRGWDTREKSWLPIDHSKTGVVKTVGLSDGDISVQVAWCGETLWGLGNTWWVNPHNLMHKKEEKEKKTMDTEDKLICSDCGCIIEEGCGCELADGRIVCEDCIGDYYFCEECEEYHTEDEVHYIDGRYICEDCAERSSQYYYCVECGEWHDTYRNCSFEIWNGDSVCENCFDYYYQSCDDCGDIFRQDDLEEIDGNYYCANCANDHRSHKIHQYGFKPSPIFKTGGSYHDVFYNEREVKDLTFGVELEIDKGDDAEDVAEDLCEASEDIYCKHDGSLGSEGVEIVTHPCTLNYHIENLGWSRLVEIARDHEYLSHDARTCGLHVHVGRYQLGKDWNERDAVAAKLVMLFDRHWDNIVKFSRRKEDQLSWANRPRMTYVDNEEILIQNALNTSSDGRYQAVNLKNDATIEFRVFNGTLNAETILATLEFVNNICKYAMAHTVDEVLDSQWDDIIKIEHHVSLEAYLARRGIVSEPLEKKPLQKYHQFKIGDPVRVTNIEHLPGRRLLNDPRMAGRYGIVAYLRSNGEIGVMFDEYYAGDMHSTHSLSGNLRSPVGYWVRQEDIEPAEDIIQEAMWIYLNKLFMYNTYKTDYDPRCTTAPTASDIRDAYYF